MVHEVCALGKKQMHNIFYKRGVYKYILFISRLLKFRHYFNHIIATELALLLCSVLSILHPVLSLLHAIFSFPHWPY